MTSLIASLLLASALGGQSGNASHELPFSDKAWELEGARTTVVKDARGDVLQMETGLAQRRDVQFEDGTIDFDVQVTRRRSFVYVFFRSVSDGEREEFYLRPHKSELPDAVQYAPVFQGRSAWQLYHGPGGTASIKFDPDTWTHVRVVVRGRSAALFVGDMTTPALLVPQHAREPRAGYLSLGGFLPPDTPGSGPIARFANVKVTTGPPSFDLDAAIAQQKAAPGPKGQIITGWSVSRAFVPKDNPESVPTLPDATTLGQFEKIAAYPSGLLELHRYVPTPKGSRVTAALARVNVRALRAATYALDLGFSDIATVFVNGRAIYRGNASYSYDLPRREGLIEYEQARVFLPLNAGDNELAVLVSDVFGGWGLMGRFADGQGLTVEAR